MNGEISRRSMTDKQRLLAISLAAYAAAIALSFALGLRMRIPYELYQFLDARALESRLGESLLHLHSQPPMLNLLLGLALKFARATNSSPESFLLVLNIALGGVAVWAFVNLAHRLLSHPLHRAIAAALFVANPVFYMNLFYFFYTFHALVLLLLIALFADRFLRDGRPIDFAAVCSSVALLVYTRSLFHFAWAFMIPLALALVRPRNPRIVTLLALTAALLLAWPIKNAALFGTFSYSSWQGFNISKGLPVNPDAVASVSEEVPNRFANITVLVETFKTDGSRNWNHYSFIPASRAKATAAREAMMQNPFSILRKAAWNYFYFTRYSGRHPYDGHLGFVQWTPPSAALPWIRAYEMIVFQDFRKPQALAHQLARPVPVRPHHVSGFMILFPLIVALACRKAYRLRHASPTEAALAAIMLYTILWVFAMCLFIDGDEGNRHRFSSEPYLLLLFFWMLTPEPTPGDKSVTSELHPA